MKEPTEDALLAQGEAFADLMDDLTALTDGYFKNVTGPRVELTLEEASEGVERDVVLRRVFRCGACEDRGHPPEAALLPCDDCGGTGQVQQAHGLLTVAVRCTPCRGAGQVADMPCTSCEGHGGERSRETVTVQVPPGASSGDRLRLPGKGDPSMAGPLDALIEVVVEEHPTLRRNADDLVTEVEISRSLAHEGGLVTVTTLAGPREIEVPPGTRDGDRITLPGLGMPRHHERAPLPVEGRVYRGIDRDGARGDQRVVWRLRPPAWGPWMLAVAAVATIASGLSLLW